MKWEKGYQDSKAGRKEEPRAELGSGRDRMFRGSFGQFLKVKSSQIRRDRQEKVRESNEENDAAESQIDRDLPGCRLAFPCSPKTKEQECGNKR